MTEAPLGNQAAPAALRRGEAHWREDLLAYDLLPEELRLAIQEAPFEAVAIGVLLAYRANLGRFGSPFMALAATAGEFSRFMDSALLSVRQIRAAHDNSVLGSLPVQRLGELHEQR
ncbi:MAG: hypothetical protein WA840_03810 [Caulobacteraceae bacterium]